VYIVLLLLAILNHIDRMAQFDLSCVDLLLLQGVTSLSCIKVLLNMILESFFQRVVSLWNSFPDDFVDSDTINCFKSVLDKFWTNQDVLYNWEADFKLGTEVYIHYNVLFKLLQFNGDEDTDKEALPESVNFRCLVL